LPRLNSVSGEVINIYPDIEKITAEIFDEEEVVDESPMGIDVVSEKS
jgi:hypothetical protein